jgi:hemin uptake protein HemP
MDLQPNAKEEQPRHVVGAARPMRQPKISSQALLGPSGELIIEHGGREYRLRLTQNGKLILTA